MKICKTFHVVACGLMLATGLMASSEAHAQTGFIFPSGDSMWLHDSRLQPGANTMIPGSQQFWHDPATGAVGRRYLGLDGRWHGETQFTNPDGSQQTHFYGSRPSGGSGSGYRPGGGGSGGYRPSTSPGGRPFSGGSYPAHRPTYRPSFGR